MCSSNENKLKESSCAIIGLRCWLIWWQISWCTIINTFLRLWWLWSFRIMDLSSTEVTVTRTLNFQIVENTFIVDLLRITAMLISQIAAALV